jgi:peptide/nickel transport system permease protein
LRASLISAVFAAGATLVACVLGLAAGTGIAVSPSRVRFVLTRALETLLAFPSLLFALGWAAVRGPGWDTLAFSLLLGSVPGLTRLVQARAREILAEDYVEAARGLGASAGRIAAHHLAPGVAELCRVKAPALFATALLAEATLSFLGLGVPIGQDSWGSLLAQGKDYLIESPHLTVGAGIPIVLTVLGLQALASD